MHKLETNSWMLDYHDQHSMIGDAQMKEKNLCLRTLLNISPQFLPSLMSFPGYLKPEHFILDSSFNTKASMTALYYLAKLLPMNHTKTLLYKDKRWQNFQKQRN